MQFLLKPLFLEQVNKYLTELLFFLHSAQVLNQPPDCWHFQHCFYLSACTDTHLADSDLGHLGLHIDRVHETETN